jgi:carbamoyltransferase
MTAILGLSAFYHDSAAALLIDGEIIAAAQEERFSRKKHDPRFPARAVEYCLREAGMTLEEVDYAGFYDKPLLKFDRLLETYLAYAPRGFRSFAAAMPVWMREKLFVPGAIRRGLRHAYQKEIVFAEHHLSHAASAFYPSPFEEAAVLTLDGVGEWATASIGVGRGHRLDITHELRFPHSLGLLYSAFTYFCGFKVNSGEYKLMGLAPYGVPRYADLIRERLVRIKDDGSFWMDMRYFSYCDGQTMTSRAFEALFGGPPRAPESPITEREMDLAASIQAVTEEIMLKMAHHAHRVTGMKNLCLAGGVALNCVGNGRLLREGPFDGLWIQPAAGDAGGALGVAFYIWHTLLDRPRVPAATDAMKGAWLGPRFDEDDICRDLDRANIPYTRWPNDDALCEHVSGLLERDLVIGWFQDRMEFGPRALGARSIIGDARSPQLQSVMNLKIKFRESFRPFAPVVLAERAADYFDMPPGAPSPYMLLVADVACDKRVTNGHEGQLGNATGLQRVNETRSVIPAVTHVDYSARVQTVDARHGRFRRLLETFERRTGCPVLINTSFNVRGEPIVCTPQQALRCFAATDMDVLVLERAVIDKAALPAQMNADRAAYLAAFQLD